MAQVLISPEAEAFALRIAKKGGFRAQREVARLYSCLKRLKSKMKLSADFWNVEDSTSGILTSSATMLDGTPIWRLCPTHGHCVALIANIAGDLYVLEISSREDISKIERKLSKLDSDECIGQSHIKRKLRKASAR